MTSSPITDHAAGNAEAGLLRREYGSTWQIECDERLQVWSALHVSGTSSRYLVAASAGELLAQAAGRAAVTGLDAVTGLEAVTAAHPGWTIRRDAGPDWLAARQLAAEQHQPILMTPGDLRRLLSRWQRAATGLLDVVDERSGLP